jgi:hypothetical protein
MDAEQGQNDCGECAQLRQELQALREQVAKLTAALEVERRRGIRQAAPFSKGAPVTEPKSPGRKSGKRHGPHAHRSMPPRIDETYDAPLPQTCPHCASEQVSETHVAVQYQTEIPSAVVLGLLATGDAAGWICCRMTGWRGVAFGRGRFRRRASVAGGLFWKGVEKARRLPCRL